MPSLKFHSLAVDDLKRLRNFLSSKNIEASNRMTKTIRENINRLKISPYLGLSSYNYRKLIIPFGHSAYIVLYSFDKYSDCVYILRVIHSREDIDHPDHDTA
jgi:plasmid stabilization system protein ParE